MRGTYSSLMNSKYFHPAFNSAIFDGPVRIYFAQLHESLALKIYFCIQKALVEEMSTARELHKKMGQTLLIMLYPNKESYGLAFDDGNFLGQGFLFEDSVMGINGPFEDDQLTTVIEAVKAEFQQWPHQPSLQIDDNHSIEEVFIERSEPEISI